MRPRASFGLVASACRLELRGSCAADEVRDVSRIRRGLYGLYVARIGPAGLYADLRRLFFPAPTRRPVCNSIQTNPTRPPSRPSCYHRGMAKRPLNPLVQLDDLKRFVAAVVAVPKAEVDAVEAKRLKRAHRAKAAIQAAIRTAGNHGKSANS
jgi:hypothetical protein